MRLLIIGCGGIGSYLTGHVCNKIQTGQIDSFMEIDIADNDMVELEQINYQNFSMDEAGMSKSKALVKRFNEYGLRAVNKRIDRKTELKGYDLIILCVDNDRIRKLAVEYCHAHDVAFIDLRATGRRYFAMIKEADLKENMKFIDSTDMKEYSCQEKKDLKKGEYQMGNEIVAVIGTQMLLNFLRGNTNRTISGVI